MCPYTFGHVVSCMSYIQSASEEKWNQQNQTLQPHVSSLRSSCALTDEVPLSIGDVSSDISLYHLQVQRPAAVRPRAELQVAALHIEWKPANVDVTGAIEYS